MTENIERPKNPFVTEIKQEEFGKDLKRYRYTEFLGKYYAALRNDAMDEKQKSKYSEYKQSLLDYKAAKRADILKKKQEREEKRKQKEAEKTEKKIKRAKEIVARQTKKKERKGLNRRAKIMAQIEANNKKNAMLEAELKK